jgi:HEAT repeat protein
MVLTAWDARQKEQLLQKWAIHWERHVQTDGEQTEAISGIILNRWLTDKTTFSPLELVLRTWSAYAGDALGPTLGDALDAYLRRMTVDIDGGITALERFAIGSVQNLAPTPTEDTASIWINNPIYHENMSSDAPLPKVGRDTLDKLVESGLVIRNHLEQYRLSHPAITGYLAGHLWQYGANPDELIEQPDWCGKYLTLAALAQNTDIIDQVDFLVNPDDPMKSGLMHMGRWLRNTNPQYRWRQEVMKQLLRVWQDTRFSFGLRARACAALFLSGDPTVRNLLKKTMTAADVVIQSLSVLGLGFLGETGAAIRLAEFLKPAEDMKTRQAACLALAQLGTQRAVNTVVTALLDGDEELQHAAAVSLSYHVSEGHKLLQEAVEDEDFMVRRAATIGIGRINESWAQELLTEIVIKESQWVVRNSAEQALVAFQDSSPYIPIPYPEPHQIPWLIEFAGQRGRGVAPGDPAIETMFTALEDNNPRVKQAAMQFLTLYEKNTIHIEMYRTYFRSRGMVQDASMNMLWHLQRVGIELPPPLQFGFDDMVR